MSEELYGILEPFGYWLPKGDSHISKWQKETGRLDHDIWTQGKILPYLNGIKYILDAGAFNGDHALFYSKVAGEGGEVLAVEAGKVAYDALDHNCELFPNENVIPVRCALWNCDGNMLVHAPRENLGASGMLLGSEGAPITTLTIDTLSRLYDINFEFIKLDIEGAEVHALEGASNTLKNLRPIMLIEVNPERLADFEKTPEDIYKILREVRYTFKPIQEGENVEQGQHDVICLPEDV